MNHPDTALALGAATIRDLTSLSIAFWHVRCQLNGTLSGLSQSILLGVSVVQLNHI